MGRSRPKQRMKGRPGMVNPDSIPTSILDAGLDGNVSPQEVFGGQQAEPEAVGKKKRLQGRELKLDEPEPWDRPVDGADVLAETLGAVRLYIAMSEEQAIAIALWAVHTFLMDKVEISPVLAITSATKRSGKTNTLRLLKAITLRPVLASSLTPASIFRAVEKARPTLLIDEMDTFIKGAEELRGILNSGHTRDAAFVIRAVGDDHEPRMFSTWAAKAVALIGNLPTTLQDRSIEIRLSRKRADELVLPLRSKALSHFEPLKRKIARFAVDIAEYVAEYEPTVPAELNDRAADNWEPLLAIADAAGGVWPEKARRAALALSGVATDDEVGILLLHDLAALYEEMGAERLPSAEIVECLTAMEGRPWPEWRHGKPLSANGLARLLKPFEIRPRQYREGSEKLRGYELCDLKEAFSRYLVGCKPVHTVQPSADADFGDLTSGTGFDAVPDGIHPLSCKVPPVPDGNSGEDKVHV